MKVSLTGNSQTGARIKTKHPNAAPQVSLEPSQAGPTLSPQTPVLPTPQLQKEQQPQLSHEDAGRTSEESENQITAQMGKELASHWVFKNGGENDNESPLHRTLQR